MEIWFYLFILSLGAMTILVCKIFFIKREIKNIELSLSKILKSETNSLITISSNDRELKNLAVALNVELKKLRKLEIEYHQGNLDLKNAITNISHDLRTPLTAIRGYLDLLDRKDLTDKQREYLRYIDKKADDLTHLTEELFTYSKTLERSDELHKEKVCLNDILEEVVCSSYSLFKEKAVEPTLAITEKKITKYLDENSLKRIFENLIYNSIKYSEGELIIKLESNGTMTISNRTTKLDATSVKRIFDRFFTVENAKKSNGIGLAIAKQLVELNGGKMKAHLKDEHLIITVEF